MEGPTAAYIVSSGDPAALNREVSGGKGSSLARLAQAGFDVPPFFVITAQAFASLHGRPLPPEFLADLRGAYESISGDRSAFAVRSSATGEDSPESSSAGLYLTRLGARSLEDIVDGVQECWASLEAPSARQYRIDRDQNDRAAMAVVVQELIVGDWSGVAFTANPVSLSLSEVVINAVPGMGETLVSGEVNPEEIVLDSISGAVKTRMGDANGNPVPDASVESVRLAAIATAETFDFPQDIEWTVRDGRLYLLQSRPITTLTALFYNRYIEPWRDMPESAEDPDTIWTRAYGDEVWTSPESPLNYSIRNPKGASAGWFGAYLPAHGDKRPLPAACAKLYKSAAYANVEVLRRIYEYHPPLARIGGVLNFFPRSMQEEIRTMPWRWRGRLRRHYQLEWKDRKRASIRRNHRYIRTFPTPLVQASDTWFDTDLEQLSLDELRAHLASEVMSQVALTGTYYAIGVMYHSFDLTFLLTGLLERWFGDGDALYAKVSSGLPNSETVAEAQAIWDLAATAREGGGDVVEEVRRSDWGGLVRAAEEDAKLDRLVRSIKEFLRDHRHRGAAYKDIYFARWGDDPDLLLGLIRASLDSKGASPSEKNALQAAERRQQQRLLLRRSITHPIRWFLLRWLFHYNEIYMGIRNDHRFYFDRLWYERRRVYRSMGRRLVAAGVLTAHDDVFFLGTDEIDAGVAGQLGLEEAYLRIDARKKEWEATLLSQAPKFLRNYTPMPDQEATASSDTLLGIAASPGIAKGRAKVVFRIEELGEVKEGDILVTRQTDPGWTPVFSRIAGLVLETGGVLAHGTSLCREYGLPCVTVVERATSRIPVGAEIEIDGSAGQVRIVEREI